MVGKRRNGQAFGPLLVASRSNGEECEPSKNAKSIDESETGDKRQSTNERVHRARVREGGGTRGAVTSVVSPKTDRQRLEGRRYVGDAD